MNRITSPAGACLIPLACWLIALAANPSVAALPRDSAAVRATLVRFWGAKSTDWSPLRPTLLLFSSTEHSISCGTASLNVALDETKTARLDMNVLVVVEAALPGEGLGLTEKFATPHVVEDTRGLAAAHFGANGSSPTAALVCPDGTITFSEPRLQIRLLNFDTLRTRVASCVGRTAGANIDTSILRTFSERTGTNSTARSHASAGALIGALDEGSRLLIDAGTPLVRGDSLWLIDPHRNLVRRFLMRSGRELPALSVDTGLGRFYERRGDSQELWKLFTDEGIMPMIVQIVDAHGTEVEAICRVYEQIAGGSRGSIMRTMRATLRNGRTIRSDSLPYLYFKPAATMLDNGILVAAAASESLDRAIYGDPKTDRVARDSMWVMLAARPGGDVGSLLPVSLIDSVAGRPFRLADGGLLARSSEKGVFFADVANDLVLHVEIDRGIVGNVRSIWDGSSRDSISIIGLVGNERHVAVLLEDRHRDARLRYVIEVASTDGSTTGSCAVPYDRDVLAAHLLGVDRNGVTLLVKSREARWQVWRSPIVSASEARSSE